MKTNILKSYVFRFGSTVFSPKTGIILNNELADFCGRADSVKPGEDPSPNISSDIWHVLKLLVTILSAVVLSRRAASLLHGSYHPAVPGEDCGDWWIRRKFYHHSHGPGESNSTWNNKLLGFSVQPILMKYTALADQH